MLIYYSLLEVTIHLFTINHAYLLFIIGGDRRVHIITMLASFVCNLWCYCLRVKLLPSCTFDGHRMIPDRVPWMFPECSLNVPWMFPECSVNVPWMFPECSLNVPWMFTECSLNVPWMFPECSLNVPWMFRECAGSLLRGHLHTRKANLDGNVADQS
jgi:hypothetical protein